MLIGSYRAASDKGAELGSHSTTADEDEGFQLKTARESFPRLLAQRRIKRMMRKIKKERRREAGRRKAQPDPTTLPVQGVGGRLPPGGLPEELLSDWWLQLQLMEARS